MEVEAGRYLLVSSLPQLVAVVLQAPMGTVIMALTSLRHLHPAQLTAAQVMLDLAVQPGLVFFHRVRRLGPMEGTALNIPLQQAELLAQVVAAVVLKRPRRATRREVMAETMVARVVPDLAVAHLASAVRGHKVSLLSHTIPLELS